MLKVGQTIAVGGQSLNEEYMRSASKYRSAGDDVSVRVSDWMKAVKAPLAYRVAGTSVYVDKTRLAKMGIIVLLVLTAIVLLIPAADYDPKVAKRLAQHANYNNTYPLSAPVKSKDGTTFRIAIIADLDTTNKIGEGKKTKWTSFFRKGHLTLNPGHDRVSVVWDTNEIQLESSLSSGGRGMELSELIAFNGKLYSCDDRTGLVVEITNDNLIIPWVILQDGDGHVEKGLCLIKSYKYKFN